MRGPKGFGHSSRDIRASLAHARSELNGSNLPSRSMIHEHTSSLSRPDHPGLRSRGLRGRGVRRAREPQAPAHYGMEEGGQLMTTVEVDNWPGDPHGLTGPALMERMRKHAERFNTEVLNEHINKVDLSQRPFRDGR